jgi:hypothetical protein
VEPAATLNSHPSCTLRCQMQPAKPLLRVHCAHGGMHEGLQAVGNNTQPPLGLSKRLVPFLSAPGPPLAAAGPQIDEALAETAC